MASRIKIPPIYLFYFILSSCKEEEEEDNKNSDVMEGGRRCVSDMSGAAFVVS